MDLTKPFSFVRPEPVLGDNNNIRAIFGQLMDVWLASGETTAIPRSQFEFVVLAHSRALTGVLFIVVRSHVCCTVC